MITATGANAAIQGDSLASVEAKDKSVLGKDDFMKLLLVELQNQDPTEPTDTEKILTQTSQLASLESADNTNKSLESLATTLSSSQEFSSISAIGKIADVGQSSISHNEGSNSTFEIFFPKSIESGSLKITDKNGNIVKTVDLEKNPSGVYQFTWDGKDSSGNRADSGVYEISADYMDADGTAQTTKMGTYPIESIKFEDGKALAKVGSSYVPLESITEIY